MILRGVGNEVKERAKEYDLSTTLQNPLEILVVEDQIWHTFSISQLVDRGFNVDLSNNMEDALERIYSKKYDYLLTDFKFPENEKGVIRKKEREIRIQLLATFYNLYPIWYQTRLLSSGKHYGGQ